MDKLKNLIESIERYSPKNYSIILILPFFILTVGFLIWSIYLYSLGFIINDLIRTRFILTGILFVIITYVIYSLIKIVYAKVGSSIGGNNSKLLFFVFLSFSWLLIYSILLFPKLPLVIGGGQPKALALIMNTEGIKLLRSFNFDLPEGAEYQTGNICLAYEGIENLIILREDRVISLDKSLVKGFINLPGINATHEQVCISFASQWSWKGFWASVLLSIITTYNSVAIPLHLPLLSFLIS